MPRPKKQHLKRRKDGRYACRYHEVWFYGDTEDEALSKREAYKRQEQSGWFSRDNPTVREYAGRWLAVSKAGVRQTTKAGVELHLRHLCDVIGDMPLREVRPTDIKRVYAEKYASASDGHIKHAKTAFLGLFNAAVEDFIIRSNPAISEASKPHRGHVGSHRSITPEERNLIETVCTDHPMHTAAIIMLYAGLRPQEVKALRMEDIYDGAIHVRRFVHRDGSNAYEVSSVGKTKKAARNVPLFPPVAEAIKGKKGMILSKGKSPATQTMWRSSWRSYCNQIERHINGMQRRWYGKTREHKALLAAEKPLPPWQSFDVTPYDLRHSFASWCRDNGVELHTVVEWMGHADATMVLRVYDEVSDARSQSEAEKLIHRAFGSQDGSQEDSQEPPDGSAPESANNSTPAS